MSAGGRPGLLDEVCARAGGRIALDDGVHAVSFDELRARVASAAVAWRAAGATVVGLCSRNGVPHAIAWLAALEAGVTLVPLPPFFARTQLESIARRSGIGLIVADDAGVADACGAREPAGAIEGITASRTAAHVPAPAAGAAVLTFTSGTTAAPKGAILSATTLVAVARSLVARTALDERRRHLCVLPLSVLLESVGGLLRGLLAGATVVVPDLPTLGVDDICAVDGTRLARALKAHAATDAILVPEALRRLAGACARDGAPPSLRFLGVGGAPVPAALHAEARAAGLPVFEGYGLTEAGSVVALNAPGDSRAGSVGRALDHARVRIAADGEIFVRGPVLERYLDGPAPRIDGWLATGDVGAIDADGYLTIEGRKGDVGITAYARNVQPRWIEDALARDGLVAQAAALIDGRPRPVAVVVTHAPRRSVAALVARVNAALPAYARVERFVVAREPFSAANGQANAFGKLDRRAIASAYAHELDAVPEATP